MARLRPFQEVERWRFVATPPRDGATNMALDVALMQRARDTGEAVLRVYGWSRPTLSLGRNQTAAKKYDRALLQDRRIDVVRRPTGGRAILHWREVTYSVTAPTNDGRPIKDVYERINELLIAALAILGVTARTASPMPARKPDSRPCFAEPSTGEIVAFRAAGTVLGKLVGSAQVQEDGALLQHGSILLEDDQRVVYELAGEPPTGAAPATLGGALGRVPAVPEVVSALAAALREEIDASGSCLDSDEVMPLADRYAERFRDPQWTWRR